MARPKKNNADYFPHDSSMRNDLKIKALRNKFGITGYAVWVMILEVLTDADFFEYTWDDISIELLAADFGVEPEKLQEIVDYCVRLKLLQNENSKIFSEHHKDRFESLFTKRKRDRKDISADDNTKSAEFNENSGEIDQQNSGEDSISDHVDISQNTDYHQRETGNLLVSVSENDKKGKLQGVSVSENPQRKEKKRKDNNKLLFISSNEDSKLNPPFFEKTNYNQIVELYHNKCPALPRVKLMTDDRRAKIKTRISEFRDKFKTEDYKSILSQLFEKMHLSDFLGGNNDRNWKADFDWFFENGKNWVKIYEGKYENKLQTKTGSVVD